MKFHCTPASAAVCALFLLGAGATAHAQDTVQPAPVVRVRPRPAAQRATAAKASAASAAPQGYRNSFPVTYGPDGVHPAPTVLPAAHSAIQAGAAGATGTRRSTPATSAHGGTIAPSASGAGGTASRGIGTAFGATGATGPRALPRPRPAAPTNGQTGATGSTAPARIAPAPAQPAISRAQPVVPAAGPTGDAVAVPIESPGALNRTVIVLDPAHGGGDDGSRLSESLVEKDVTLAVAFKLRSLLQARGFTVVMTREAEAAAGQAPPAPPSLDDRAGIANHAHAAACLLLHATSTGTGVHLYRSELAAAATEPAIVPWLTAQAAWMPQSTALADRFSQSLHRAGIPLVSSAASVRPLDSLTCPAIVVELAPKSAGDAETLSDESYQADVSQALAATLVFWKSQVQPPRHAEAGASQAGASAAAPHHTPASVARASTGTAGTGAQASSRKEPQP